MNKRNLGVLIIVVVCVVASIYGISHFTKENEVVKPPATNQQDAVTKGPETKQAVSNANAIDDSHLIDRQKVVVKLNNMPRTSSQMPIKYSLAIDDSTVLVQYHPKLTAQKIEDMFHDEDHKFSIGTYRQIAALYKKYGFSKVIYSNGTLSWEADICDTGFCNSVGPFPANLPVPDSPIWIIPESSANNTDAQEAITIPDQPEPRLIGYTSKEEVLARCGKPLKEAMNGGWIFKTSKRAADRFHIQEVTIMFSSYGKPYISYVGSDGGSLSNHALLVAMPCLGK